MPGDVNPATAYLGLGSNLGDRLGMMRAALGALDEHEYIFVDYQTGVASLYETSPVGGPVSQPDYLNSAARIRTALTSHDLLHVLLTIEATLGRKRRRRRGPRSIDIDLLLYGEAVINDKILSLPHPRLAERRFVLEPLAEIAGEVVHPVLKTTITEITRHRRRTETSETVVLVAGPLWYQDW